MWKQLCLEPPLTFKHEVPWPNIYHIFIIVYQFPRGGLLLFADYTTHFSCNHHITSSLKQHTAGYITVIHYRDLLSPRIFDGKASAPDFIAIIWGTLAPPYPDTSIKSKLESLNVDIQAIESKHDSFHIQKMIMAIKSRAKYWGCNFGWKHSAWR